MLFRSDEVYDRPATPFVLQFLGDVNLLSDGEAIGYVRPHELEVLPLAADRSLPAVLAHHPDALWLEDPVGAPAQLPLTAEDLRAAGSRDRR